MRAPFEKTILILCCLQLCSSLYFLQLRRGRVCWYDARQSCWHETDTSAEALLPQDRALLSGGLAFDSHAALTRALEDFCS